MKNLITLMVLFILSSFKTYSQEYVIENCVDTKTFSTKSGLICSNEERTKWFSIQFIYNSNTANPTVNCFKVLKSNIGTYTDTGALMVFTFMDMTDIKLKARTGQLEDLTVEFNLTSNDLVQLSTKSVISIRYINGTDYKSLTYYPMNTENRFFLNALNYYTLKRIKCN